MKITPQERKSKMRLNVCIQLLGFHEVQKITELSGSSVGQYVCLEYARCIPEHKLKLVELTICRKNLSSS